MKMIQSNRPLMMDVFHPQFVNRFFEGAFDPEISTVSAKGAFRPAVEVLQTENAIHLALALPGMKKEDVKIELNNEGLQVSGERKRESQVEEKGRFYSEMAYGKFSRLFTLKEEANRDKITAEFSEGLLNIHIPLKEKEAVKAIEIR